MQIFRKYYGLLIIFLFSALIVTRIFHPGFFEVHDDVQPTRIFEMAKSLRDHLFPVRWVQDLGFGYGYPIFNFYAPFPYYIGAIFNLTGFDAISSAKIMFAIPVVAAGIGMFLFVNSFLGTLPAIAAGVIYLFFPYFAVNIFIRGAVGEYYAYAILPYIFWGMFKIYYENSNFEYRNTKSRQTRLSQILNLNEKNSKRFKKYNFKHSEIVSSLGFRVSDFIQCKWILMTSLAFTALIISHNLSAFMLLLFLIFFLIGCFIFGENKKILIVNYGLIFVFAFLFSAFYTLPAVFEMKYTDVNSQLQGNFNYSNHFACPIQWWESPWGFAGSAKGCLDDGFSFRLGKSDIIFAVFGLFTGIYIFLIKKKRKYLFLFFSVVFMLFLSLFMMTEYSKIFWDLIPKIEFLQFPWRFLNLTGFSLAVLTGFFVFFLKKEKNIYPLFAVSIIIIGTIWFNFKLFSPQFYNSRTSGYYTDKEQINFKLSKITNEYMPEGFERPKSISQIPELPLEIPGGAGDIGLLKNSTGSVHAILKMRKDGNVQVNKAYFPAWKLYIDNDQSDIRGISKGMMFLLSKGEHNIRLEFVQTPIENLGNILTITGVIVLFIAIITIIKDFSYVKKTT